MMAAYYQKIVDVTKDYLGPAAERFVNRQISFHLEKKPEDLTREDVEKIATLVRTSLNLLTRDQATVDQAFKRISDLALSNGNGF